MLLNLPFTKDKKEKPLPFYAVELSDEMVKVAVWQIDEGIVSVIRTSEVITINGSKMDDYLQAVDMAIATVMTDGEPDPKEVLYGLPPEWVDEKGVVAARRSLLKYISDKLQLKPIGFVMIVDALIEYLRARQSTPPSAIFIRFRKQMLDISLVTLGKIIQMESVGRSNDISMDVKEGLMRLKNKGQLPPRIILFDGYLNFADITQQLMTVTWEKEFPFGHTPLIESLVQDMTVEAVAIAAGKEAVKNTALEKDEQPQTAMIDSVVVSSQPIPVPVKSETGELPMGFSVGLNPDQTKIDDNAQGEIVVTKTEIANQIEPIITQTESILPADEQDKTASIAKSSENDLISDTNIKDRAIKTPLLIKIKKTLSSISISKLFSKSEQVPQLDEPVLDSDDIQDENVKPKLPWWLWIIGVIVLILVLGGTGVWAHTNLRKADIKIGIKSQVVEQEVNITLAPDLTQMDETNLLLPAEFVESTASGSQTVPTTGSKRTGKTATGKITIYNKTDKDKSFTKGTVLVGPGNLRFILDNDTKVASSSTKMNSDNSEIKTYGEVQTSISAGDIGEEYNQNMGQEFSFKDFGSDDYMAKNTEAIAGGESIEQKAVAKIDLTNAKELLTQTLEAQATQTLNKSLGNGLMVIDKTQQSEPDTIDYDKKIGDASDEIIAEGEIAMSALAVKKDNFNRILLKALAAKIPANFQITAAGLQSQITDINEITPDTKASKDKQEEPVRYSITVKAQVRILPKLDFAQIKQTLKGKTPQITNDVIKSLPNYNSHTLTITPNLPGFLNTMPSKTERISIMIEEING